MVDAYRHQAELPPEPPDSTPDLAALQRKASRRLRLGLLGAVVVLGGGVAAGVVTMQRQQGAELQAAASELRGCLLRGPLAEKETASLRVRRLQLGAMSTSQADRIAPGAELYPLACHGKVAKAVEVLRARGMADADLSPLAGLVKRLEAAAAVSEDLSGAIDGAIAIVDRESPGAVPPGASPPPAPPLDVDALAAVTPLSKEGTSLGHSYTEENPGLSLPVLIDEKDLPEAPLLCRFGVAAEDATCRTLAELRGAQLHGLRLLGTSDEGAKVLVFAGNRGAEGVFRTGSGTYIDRLYSYGGYSKADGSVAILGWDEQKKNLVLSRKEGEGAAIRLALKPSFRVGNYFYGSQMLWDQVLVRGVTEQNERRLFVLPLAEADKRTFELADIGELPEPGLIREGEEDSPHLTGCKTEQMTLVRVKGRSNDFLTFRLGNGFSRPVDAPTGGLLGCFGTTATIVRVQFGQAPSHLILHNACTSAGCTRTPVKNEILDRGTTELKPLDEKRVAAVDLGGKLIVVWSAGERGGLRMRVGSPAAFDKAADAVVLDDHVKDGKVVTESTLLGFRLFSRQKFAVLLVSTLAGLHALRIDENGGVKPWAVKPGAP